MNDPTSNVIYFPHTFPGTPKPNTLDDKLITFNDIDGGIVKISDFGYVSNRFLGGECIHLGLMKKYGFYACPDRANKVILAFHVENPALMTALGKKVFEERFPGHRIVYKEYKPDFVMADEDPAEREDIIRQFESVGGSPIMIRKISSKAILDLIKVLKSGTSEKKFAEFSPATFVPAAKEDEVTANLTGRGVPPKEVVDAFRKQRAKAQQN